MNSSHISIVLTIDVCKNIDTFLEKIIGPLFDVDSVSRSWSIVLLNKNNTTVITIQKIIDILPQSCNNLIEFYNSNEKKWDRDRLIYEVYKRLPYSIVDKYNRLYIIIDKESLKQNIVLPNFI